MRDRPSAHGHFKSGQEWVVHEAEKFLLAAAAQKYASEMQASLRHHYLPVSYLKRWAGTNRKICEFSRPYKEIYKRRVYPVQTSFIDRLYEMKGVPQTAAQQVEEEFIEAGRYSGSESARHVGGRQRPD